jgi:hypothetical protein
LNGLHRILALSTKVDEVVEYNNIGNLQKALMTFAGLFGLNFNLPPMLSQTRPWTSLGLVLNLLTKVPMLRYGR